VPTSQYPAFALIRQNTVWSSKTGAVWTPVKLSLERIAVLNNSVDSDAALLTETPDGMVWLAGQTRSGSPALVHLTTPGTASRPMAIGPRRGTIQAMDWSSAKIGWVVVSSSQATGYPSQSVFETDDGGRTWSKRATWAHPKDALTGIDMTSSTQGWALSSSSGACETVFDTCGTALWHTKDGMRTWTRVTIPTIFYRYPNGSQSKLVGLVLAGTQGNAGATIWDGFNLDSVYYSERLWTNNNGKTWHMAAGSPKEPGEPATS
jgi:hypothetical protein